MTPAELAYTHGAKAMRRAIVEVGRSRGVPMSPDEVGSVPLPPFPKDHHVTPAELVERVSSAINAEFARAKTETTDGQVPVAWIAAAAIRVVVDDAVTTCGFIEADALNRENEDGANAAASCARLLRALLPPEAT